MKKQSDPKRARRSDPSNDNPETEDDRVAIGDNPRRTYLVPGEVAVAISAGRHQLIDGLVKKVQAGHVLEPRLVVGLLEVIRDMTKDRRADSVRSQRIAAMTGDAMVELQELHAKVGDLRDRVGAAGRVSSRLGTSTPLGPEDDLE
jgi:hypothetical protein